MSAFVSSEIDAIDIGDGDVVYIKRAMAYADFRRLSTSKDDDAEIGIAMLERNIVKWEGPSFVRDGAPVPVTREAIDLLRPAVVNVLADAISERNVGPLAVSGSGSSTSATTSPTGSPDATPSSTSAAPSAGPGTSS